MSGYQIRFKPSSRSGPGRRTLFCLLVLIAGLLWAASGNRVLPAMAVQAPSVQELDERLAREVAVGDLISLAVHRNPSVEAARQQWRASVEKYRLVTGLPDPQVMVTYFPDPIETRLGPQDWNASLSQAIPFPGKLARAGDVVQVEADIARLRLDQTLRQVATDLRESFHELDYIRNARQITAHNIELVDHLRKVGESAVADDRATLMDMVKAQSQVGQLRYDALLLEELEQTEITRLNGLLNRSPGAPIGPLAPVSTGVPVYGLDEIYTLAEAHQEALRMAALQVDRAGAKVELARLQKYPDFKVGLFYAGIGDPDVLMRPPDAGQDAMGVQMGFSIPLWFGKNRGRVAGARAELGQARAEHSQQINQTRTRIRNLHFRLQNAHRILTLYRDELLPQAAQAMEIAETWFQEGQGSFSDFIETQSVWYNFQLARARARADVGKFTARLERLVGRNLTRPPSTTGDNTGKEAP